MKLLGDLPLQRKVTAVIVLTCGVALLAACGAMFAYHLYTFRGGFERSLTALAEIIANNSSAPLAFKDKVAATETLSALKATPHILYACIRTPDGEEFARYGGPDLAAERRQFPTERGFHHVGGHLLQTQPIMLEGHPIGRLLIRSDYDSVFHGLLRIYAALVAVVLAGALLLAWLLSSQLQRVISRPILHLVQTAQRVAREQDFTIRAECSSRDEIGVLAESLNHMLAQVQEHDIALRRINLTELQREIADRKRAEEIAGKERDRARQYFDIAGVMLLVLDPEGRVVLLNQRGCAMLGCESGDILGREWFSTCLPDELRSGVQEQFRAMMALGIDGIHFSEHAVLARTGERRIIQFYTTLIRDSASRIVGTLSSGEDVTERKQAEETRRLEEARLETLVRLANLQNAPLEEITHFALEEGVRLTRSKMGYLAFLSEDESTLTMHAWSKDAMKECAIDNPPRDYPVAQTGLWGEAVRRRQPVITNDYQAQNHAKKGTPPGHVAVKRHMNVPLFDGERIVAVAGVGNKEAPYDESDVRQLTLLMDGMWRLVQRKRTAEALRQSEEKFRTLFDNAKEAILIHGMEGRIIEANREASDRLGYSRDELLRMSVQDVDAPEYAALVPARMKTLLQQGHHLFESVHRHASGSLVPVEVSVRVFELAGKRLILSTSRNITERRKAEQERAAMELQLQQAQKLESIGRLAAGIAHEINTPTQYIGDNTRFLHDAFGDLNKLLTDYDRLRQAAEEQGLLPEWVAQVNTTAQTVDAGYLINEVPKAVGQSLEGVERVARIVRAMKEFSHPGSQEKTAVNLNQAIESTITVARNEWKYVADLVLDLQPSLTPVLCLPGEFNQVILNLVINAAHAIAEKVGDGSKGKGTIIVSTRRVADWVEVRVKDTGTGIAKAIRDRMFEPFFTTKPLGKGTGQGLAIARSVIVDKHGGTITFESEEGQGTTFIIRLPINPTVTTKQRIAA